MILLILVGILIGVAVLAFIAYPIVRPSGPSRYRVGGSGVALLTRRDRILGELREVEFDLRVGKITREDHDDARSRLELEAARVLQAIDTQVAALSEEIEREVRELRQVPENQAPPRRSAPGQSRPKLRTCPSCDAQITAGARFCAACGASLKVTAKR